MALGNVQTNGLIYLLLVAVGMLTSRAGGKYSESLSSQTQLLKSGLWQLTQDEPDSFFNANEAGVERDRLTLGV